MLFQNVASFFSNNQNQHCYKQLKQQNANRVSHIASSPISQISFSEEVRCLVWLGGHIEFL